jgi:alpha,alpha-trehalase
MINGGGMRAVALLFAAALLTQTQFGFTQSTGATASSPSAITFDANSADVVALRSYIRDAWGTLTRSMTDCKSLVDPKVTHKPILYLPQESETPAEVQKLQAECGVTAEHLPQRITHTGELNPSQIEQQGLLYLPNPYVVPGGRFNEMYGWDSYFIIVGLLQDGRGDVARGMIENFFYEIEHYGGVLNANRTYYLTRSQPPFLTSMIMSYYHQREDRTWLARAYTYAKRDYELWTHDPHLAGTTSLARYFDFGEGAVPEMGDDPHYYSEVSSYLMLHPYSDYRLFTTEQPGSQTNLTPQSPVGPRFSFQVCGDTKGNTANEQPCASTQHFSLTEDYYKGDRAMRESGFDISFRFGPFSSSTHHFAPVCLNSLLYKEEKDMEAMATVLGKQDEASQWRQKAEARKAAVNRYFWNSQKGMFFDFDFTKGRQSTYDYATTFYPLWAGLASPEQARAVARNLKIFEKEGGIAMSDQMTGVQWDLPYGWAPLQLITAEGLRHYHFDADADRISRKFVSTVLENFKRDGTIREKYNVVTRTTQAVVAAGYKANVVGFGWTNGVTLQLLDEMKK